MPPALKRLEMNVGFVEISRSDTNLLPHRLSLFDRLVVMTTLLRVDDLRVLGDQIRNLHRSVRRGLEPVNRAHHERPDPSYLVIGRLSDGEYSTPDAGDLGFVRPNFAPRQGVGA